MLFLLQALSLLLELSLSMDMKAHFMTTTIFMEDPVLRNLHNMTTVGAIGTILVVKFAREGYKTRYIFWVKNQLKENSFTLKIKPSKKGIILENKVFQKMSI